MNKLTNTNAVIPLSLADLYKDKKAIDVAIDDVRARGAGLQREVHKVACSVLQHVNKHGNVNVVSHFLDAIPDMVRKNSLKTWFETFGKVTYVDGKCMHDKMKKARLGDALDKPFWKFKAMEGMPYKPLAMQDYLEQNIKRMEKDIKEAPYKGAGIDIRVGILSAFKAAKNGTATVN